MEEPHTPTPHGQQSLSKAASRLVFVGLPWLPVLILELFAISGNASGHVGIVRVSDGTVVGRDFARKEYGNWVVARDETLGKIAVIEWGHYQSTIKIFNFAEGKFKRHSVGIGRWNGLDGAHYYNFASNDFIFHDAEGLHFYGKDSKPRKIPNPLPNNYDAASIIPCDDGLLIKAAYRAGDYRGSILYRYLQKDGSIKKIFESSDGIRAWGSGGGYAILAEDIKAEYTNQYIVRIDLTGKVLSKVKAPLSPDSVSIKKDSLYDFSARGDSVCRFKEVDSENGTVLRTLEFPEIGEPIVDVLDDMAIVGGDQTAGVFDIGEKKMVRRFKCDYSWSTLALMKYKGEIYCILCD